jgi:hypothetical protein
MNQGLMEKIQALLAKADATEFEAEAESFYAKAQQLMLENAVSEQLVRSLAGGTREMPVSRVIHYSVEDRCVPGKLRIFAAVCATNRVKFVLNERDDRRNDVFKGGYYRRNQWTAIAVGFASDIDYVETLFASLFIQAVSESRRRGFRTCREQTAFMIGFAETAKVRLEEFNASFVNETSHGNALALRDRSQDVTDKYCEMFPRTKMRASTAQGDARAQFSGRQAGSEANVSSGRRNLGTTRVLGR